MKKQPMTLSSRIGLSVLCASALLFTGQSAIAQSTWYFNLTTPNPGGLDLNTLTNWYANSDQTGANPGSFDSNDTWLFNRRAFTNGTFPVNLTTNGIAAELDARSQSHVYESITAANVGRLDVFARVGTIAVPENQNNTIKINNLVITNSAAAVAARFLTDTANERSFGTSSGTGIIISNLTGVGDVSGKTIFFGDGSSSSLLETNVTIGDTTGFNGLLWARNTQFGLWDDLNLLEDGVRFQTSETTGINFRSFNITTAADGFQLGSFVLAAGSYSVADLNTLAVTHAPTVTFSSTGGGLTVVPEPATYALLTGLLVIGLVLGKRRRLSV